MPLAAEKKSELVREHRVHDKDTGSPEVQISLLTARINDLAEHMRDHKHDFSSRRGLLQLVSKRNRLLRYLAKSDLDRYRALIKRLGLRK